MRKSQIIAQLSKVDKATLEKTLLVAQLINSGVVDNGLLNIKGESKDKGEDKVEEMPKGTFYTAKLKGLEKGFNPHFRACKKSAVNDFKAYYNKVDNTFEFKSKATRTKFVNAQKEYDNKFVLAEVTR